MGQTIPALPVRSVSAAAAFYRERLGFTVLHEDRGFAIVVRDAAEIHLWGASDETWSTRDDRETNPVCSGAESFIAGTASCRVAVEGIDELYDELGASDVLHSPRTVVEVNRRLPEPQADPLARSGLSWLLPARGFLSGRVVATSPRRRCAPGAGGAAQLWRDGRVGRAPPGGSADGPDELRRGWRACM